MGQSSTNDEVPPRVVIVMRDQWRRAMLRAALRAIGYDAIGVRDLGEALLVPADVSDRGKVRLVIVDQTAFAGGGGVPAAVQQRYPAAATILLGRATVAAPQGEWTSVLRRPFTVDDIVSATEALLPLPDALRHPID